MRSHHTVWPACAAILATAFLAACGACTPPATPAATVTATVTATVPAPTAPATVTESPEPADPPKQKTDAPAAPAEEKKKLPDVVGMNLQAGQDTLQAAGFYVLNDKDATGQNRFQVFDRNWVITKQTPAGGRTVSTSTLITLYAKKIGE
ncbi:PASTA domain-containing protein [Nonomuraea sp. SMC257]|uniref:PASTA domain-containing protein n=1 Tax=Nonomuraea montanisoli TaxID=2741721 RepID=A0A7Y6M235_9ACTN|nr:PASTA domain-containing protein [Nonomuraea montanisoli]NUW30754.1 PASTA domain-containing protein [Nonomuraea montanisoli]